MLTNFSRFNHCYLHVNCQVKIVKKLVAIENCIISSHRKKINKMLLIRIQPYIDFY